MNDNALVVLIQLTKFLEVFFSTFQWNLHKQYVSLCGTAILEVIQLHVSEIYYCSNLGPGCSKLTTSLVNVSLKFQTLVSQYANIFC